jgi:zinc transport system substrate-binding protein
VLAILLVAGCDDSGEAVSDASMVETDGGLEEDGGALVDGGTNDDDGGGGSNEDEATMGRLVVAHASEPTLWVWDLDAEEPTLEGTLTVTGPATVYGTVHGQYGYALQRGHDVVHILDQGISIESHGDHAHVDKDPPRLLESRLEGPVPTHFAHNQGHAAIFYDGSGAVDVLIESSLSAASLVRHRLETGVAHHGLAIAAFGHVLASIADAPAEPEGRARPDRVGIWELDDLDGAPESEAAPCPGLHGQVAAGDWILFGCTDGVLAVEYHEDHFEPAIVIGNPEGTPEGTRVGTLWARGDVFVGNWGTHGLVRIDPEARTFGDPVTLPARQRGAAFDMRGEHVLVLTVDGNLHRLELDLSAAGHPLPVVGAFDASATPRPQISVGANRIYVTDPANNRVREVHTDEWEIQRDIALPGPPGSLVVLSVSPDYGEEHHHEHD